ncbi:MAG: hypothetical protein R2718_06125 [Solirubrobacterales bacterium]|nr:hypothetical protein [Solirubrobacterales bacterium]
MSRIPPRWRPLVPALSIVPMFAAFILFGTEAAVLVAGLTLAAIIAVAVADRDDGAFEVATPGAGVPGGVLVIVLAPIEDPRTAGVLAAIGDPSRPEAGDRGLLLLAPARSRAIDRWTDDLESARYESQRVLTVSMATMAAAGVEAEGRVGDGDVVQAAEDVLRSYAATEVVVVARAREFERPIAELERRLDRPLRRIVVEGGEA